MQDDVLVVGGSFAGLCCAEVVADAGLKVRVIERKASSGSQPHTTGILVKEAAELLGVPASYTHRLEGVRLYSPSLKHIDLISADYYFLATDTSALLDWLAKQAQSRGVRLNYGSRIEHVQHNAQAVSLNCGEYGGRYLVGADGARSSVARLCGLQQNRQFLFGVEVGVHNMRGVDPNLMHVFIDPQLAPGYIAWVLPGVGMTQVGLAARYPQRPQLDRFLHRLSRVFDLSAAKKLEYRAGLIPCGGTLSDIAKPGVMLLGDAAGTVSPLTAGGIYPALSTAEQAGNAIAEYMQAEGAEPSRLVRKSMPNYHGKRLMRRAYDLLPGSPLLVEGLMKSTLFSMLAQTVFYHHRGLLSRAAWQDIWRVCSGRYD